MLSPLTWAILALTLPFSMAQRVHHDVKWEDLMVATSQFPRFFGEPANITRTGDAKVHAMYLEDGTVMSMNCYNTVVKGEWLRCDVDCDGCVTMTDALLDGIDQAQQWFKPDLNNLTFVLRRTDEHEGEDGWWFRTFFFDQTNLGGKIEIDNAIVQLYLDTAANGDLYERDDPRLDVYTGEFDHGNSTPSCTQFEARDLAEHAAFDQPFWEALYPPKESKLVYTVQDGRLYLTWRITFNLVDKVGDDFIAWVDARNCDKIVAAAPAKLDPYVKSLEDFSKAQVQMFQDRGLPIEPGPE